jgi:hypothetical protein
VSLSVSSAELSGPHDFFVPTVSTLTQPAAGCRARDPAGRDQGAIQQRYSQQQLQGTTEEDGFPRTEFGAAHPRSEAGAPRLPAVALFFFFLAVFVCLTVARSQLVDQNSALKKEAGIAERKLLARNERIQNLEALLQDADRRLAMQNQKFEAQLQAVKDRLDQARGRLAILLDLSSAVR